MSDVAVVEIQEVGRTVIRFEHCQIFLSELAVPGITGVQGEKKRQVGVVGVQQIQVPEVEGVVSRDRGEKGIQQVVALSIELGVMHAKDFVELRRCQFDCGEIAVVEDDRKRKKAEEIGVKFDLLDSFSEFAHLRFLSVIEQGVSGRVIVQIDLAHKRALGVVKVPALGLDVSACSAGFLFLPFGYNVVVGTDIEKAL